MTKASIWVDADACPVAIKEILYRAAMRTATTTTLVANQPLQTPGSPHIRSLQVSQGFDVADGEICQRLAPGDLVVTGDIPLAAEAVGLGATALDPRGEYHTRATIRSRLNMRDFMETMRSAGLHTSSAPPLSQTDRQRFANALDRWLQNQR